MQLIDEPKKISIAFARDGDKRSIPDTSQIGVINGAASYPTGFPPLTFIKKTDGGIPPDGEDFNGIFYEITAVQRWQSAGGIFKFDSNLAASIGGYPKGATVLKSDGSGTWFNTTDNNSNNPDSGGAGWIEPPGVPQFSTYAMLRGYTGTQGVVFVTGPGIAGAFVRLTSGTDDGGVTIRGNNGFIWGRISSGDIAAQWFGAKFDFDAVANTGTDDTAAIQACVDYAQPLQKTISLPSGTAKVTASIRIAFSLFGLNMRGQGFQKTRLNYAGIVPAVNAAIVITGHPGQLCGAEIYGIGFDGNATSSGIVIQGQCGQYVRNCQFGQNANGIVFRNNAAGQFTEYSVGYNCDFLPGCPTAAWYNVQNSGDQSFNGSGLIGFTIATPSTAGFRSIVVDPTALPYNAPMSGQVWGNAVGDFISMAGYSGTNQPYFVGTITVEPLQPGLRMCNAPAVRMVPLVGKIACANPNMSMGAMYIVDAVIANSGGTVQTVGGRVEQLQQLTPGANVIGRMPPSMYKGAIEYMLHIIGPTYDYRYKVGTFATLAGGVPVILATYSQNNQAGYGAPTFSLDPTTGALVVTNAAYPATGVSVTVSAAQVGQSVYDPFFV